MQEIKQATFRSNLDTRPFGRRDDLTPPELELPNIVVVVDGCRHDDGC